MNFENVRLQPKSEIFLFLHSGSVFEKIPDIFMFLEIDTLTKNYSRCDLVNERTIVLERVTILL